MNLFAYIKKTPYLCTMRNKQSINLIKKNMKKLFTIIAITIISLFLYRLFALLFINVFINF